MNRRAVSGIAIPLLFVLAACGNNSSTDNAEAESPAETAVATPTESKASKTESPKARTQIDDCEWESPTLTAAVPSSLPEDRGEAGLHDAVIGSWQHTHFNAGSGWEAIENKDIRYVFPSSKRLRYCQDVPGITDKMDSVADFAWDGDKIAPGASPGFTPFAWSDDVMLWTNHQDGSTYLLQRRN